MPLNWYRLKDFAIQVTQLGMTFCANTFFFKIAEKYLQRLTSAGIMQWMIEHETKDLCIFKTFLIFAFCNWLSIEKTSIGHLYGFHLIMAAIMVYRQPVRT